MGLLARIPEKTRKAIVRRAPKGLVRQLRRFIMRKYDPSISVERQSPTRRWVSKHVLRLHYMPSMVTRESRARRWLRRRFTRKLPKLYHFEVHITEHCNLNCKGCGHFSILFAPTYLSLQDFQSEMCSVAERLEVEQIFLMGGEPLLHPDLPEFVRAGREIFSSTRIYVMTNGTLVLRQPEELWQALAETGTILLCDWYPIDLPREEIEQCAHAHGVTVEWTGYRAEFFKLPIDPAGTQDPANSHMRCEGICNCPMLRDGRMYPCAYAAYGHKLGEHFGIAGLEATPEDSICVAEHSGQEIMDFLSRPVPWCSHCDFDSFHMYEWGRSARRLDEWVESD